MKIFESLTSRLRIGINILKYCKAKNQTLSEGCRAFEKNEKFLRRLRGETAPKTEEEVRMKELFLDLYKDYLGDDSDIQLNNEFTLKDSESTTTQHDEDLLGGDTVIEEETTEKIEKDNTLQIDFRGKKIIKTVKELLEETNVDLAIWKEEKGVVNKWDVTMRGADGDPITAQNFQVKVWLSRIRTIEEQKAFDNFLEAISASAPDLSYLAKPKSQQGTKYMLELSIPDLHIGKLAHEDEVGENYDTKIAVNRYNESVNKLLSHVSHYKDEIEEILLPIGNDLLQIDKMEGTTTAGTKVDTDSRWQQMFLKAKDLIINTINKLAGIAPVKVVMVHGNHDNQTIFYLGELLQAYYKDLGLVTVDNAPTQRKYYVYGTNLVGFTHGNEEKHHDLGLIMATEKPQLWAATKYRQIHLGHFHSRKTTKYVDVQEFQGFQVRILPSLSSSDKWHNTKGYMSIKSAVAFLYDKENGMIGEFSHNVL